MQNGLKANDLIKVLEEAKQKVPEQLAQLANTVHSFAARGSNRGSRGTFKRGKGVTPNDSAKRGRYNDSGYNGGAYTNGNTWDAPGFGSRW